jgi:hypothetical protein
MRKMNWSKYRTKQIAAKPAPTKITEEDLGPLLGQLLYDPLDERAAPQDRSLITDVEVIQTKPETLEDPHIPILTHAQISAGAR